AEAIGHDGEGLAVAGGDAGPLVHGHGEAAHENVPAAEGAGDGQVGGPDVQGGVVGGLNVGDGEGAQPDQVDAAARHEAGAHGHGGRCERGVEQDGVVGGADGARGVEGDLTAAGNGRGAVPAGGDDAAVAGAEPDVAAAGGQGGASGGIQDD